MDKNDCNNMARCDKCGPILDVNAAFEYQGKLIERCKALEAENQKLRDVLDEISTTWDGFSGLMAMHDALEKIVQLSQMGAKSGE